MIHLRIPEIGTISYQRFFANRMVTGRLSVIFNSKEYPVSYNESSKIGWLKQFLSVCENGLISWNRTKFGYHQMICAS